MYEDEDLMFSEVDDFSWTVRCHNIALGSVLYGDDYLVRLVNGDSYIARDRSAVVEILLEFANSFKAGSA